MKAMLYRLDIWLRSAYRWSTAENLGLYRVFFVLFLFVFVGVPQYSYKVVDFPGGFFDPPPFFGFFVQELPSLLYFQITDVLIVLGMTLVLLGWQTRAAGIISALLIIVNNGMIYSTGKIDHTFMVYFSFLMLSFTHWGQYWSVSMFTRIKKKDRKKHFSPLIAILSCSLGFSFFTAGMIKAVSGWLSTSDQMLRGFFLKNYYILGKQDLVASWFTDFHLPVFWELGDWFTIVFEIGFLLVIFWPTLFRYFTVVALFFHGFVLWMFNINFILYLPLYALFWVPVVAPHLVNRMHLFFQGISEDRRQARLSTILFLFAFIAVFIGVVDRGETHRTVQIIVTSLGLVLSVYLLFIRPQHIFRRPDVKRDQVAGVVEFDGVCNLCNGFIQILIKKDSRNVLRFRTLQSTSDPLAEFSTIYFRSEGKLYTKSSAFLHIVKELKGGWGYLFFGILIPKFIRDTIYDLVAKNRYKWFGKKDACMLPTPEIQSKFL